MLGYPMVYFGCENGDVGHFLWSPQMTRLRESVTPWDSSIDGSLVPSHKQGEAAIHHKDGHTALSFADYSVDTRGGSHSTYVAEGIFDFDGMVTLAKHLFPHIWARYAFEIKERSQAAGTT